MITLEVILERVEEYIKEKGGGPLSFQEVIYLMRKVADVLNGPVTSIKELEENLVLCIGIGVCTLRGYKVPDPIIWRGRTIAVGSV